MRQCFAALVFLLSTILTPQLHATLANAWHIPDDSTDLGGTHMRNPEFEIANTTSITVYSGLQKLNNSYGTANQTGGTLYYKGATQTVWQQVSLGYDSQNGNNQYWKASFVPNSAAIGVDDVIQYYLYLTFDGTNGVQNTYVYAPTGFGDHASNVTATQATAAAAPFTIRNRPAWNFHADNRVVNGTTVQFWTEAGYQSKDGAQNWVTNGAIYYTTDGTTPTGSLGVGSGSTQAVPLSFDHEQDNPSVAGNGVWWFGTATNLPTFTTINYKVGVWNSGNNEEKFADYNAPTDTFAGHVFSFSLGTLGDPVLTVNGLNADYTTTHLFIDESLGDAPALTINFSPNASNVDPATVQVYTNLNRRDLATQIYNGEEEGIQPPSGDVVGTDDSHYYKAYTMTQSGTGNYTLTLSATKTGAYRLTARYKTTADESTWIYYTMNGRRDHAIVVSPTKARNIVLYELNTLNANATSDTEATRGIFNDLDDTDTRGGSSHRLDLNYVKSLGCNMLWFQPIHPVGIDGRQINPNTNLPYSVGSPYSVMNFFEVNAEMGAAETTDEAMTEFQSFVGAADAAGVDVMLDAPFNHTSFDCQLAQEGVDLISPGSQPTDEIRDKEARFFSQTNDYFDRASSAATVAIAPDRDDFGKFDDVHDVFFGSYSCLVDVNPDDDGNYTNEQDQFYYTDTDWTSTDFTSNGVGQNVTRNVWKYFSDYILFWLNQTGGTPANLAVNPNAGIDALRADFGQGLPPQCWEYIINKTRSQKWNFVFMTESLDGGAVTYRSNRHFDILNENIIFDFQNAATTQDYRNIFDERRSEYGQGLVLLNSTSHDEESYADPFEALIRYTVGGTIDGAPMLFYGQENGISQDFGFSDYELNFGKEIPQFKEFNSLQPILSNETYGLNQLFPVYAGVGDARQFSAALRSSNRYYLNQTGDGSIQPEIFSVAKYEVDSGSPATTDVVFAFANLDRNDDQGGNFNLNVSGTNGNLFGIKSNRNYNFKNIAAYLGVDPNRRNVFLNPQTGAQLLSSGLYVLLHKVPTDDATWATAPFEAQYLKLYDVTAPTGTPGTPTPSNAYGYVLGTSATITWAAAPPDSEGVVPSYKVSVTVNGGTPTVYYTSNTFLTFAVAPGETITATVEAVNPNDNTVGGPSSGTATIKAIDPNADDDGDGMINSAEDTAGTNPFSSTSLLRVTDIHAVSSATTSITWDSVAGKVYQVETSPSPSGTYVAVGGQVTATTSSTSETFPTTGPAFYHVRVVQ